MSTKKTAQYGLLTALAFIFSYIESVIMVPVPVPGIKLGLANLVVLAALYRMGKGPAAFVSVIRVVLAGLTFHNTMMMLYSLAGCMLSLFVMILLKKTGRFGMVGVSAAGGVMHNLGQLLVAAALLETSALVWYFPALMVSGCITGIVIGVAGAEIVKRLPH
ncbi:MAG: Gx transporter family protein [Lachnospiraceae bacterium]|jgi:heptaprenyl diphosphate synthase|nr:Gx transporter family protein [Lachnospiraceae bacterium]